MADIADVEAGFALILQGLGVDLANPHFKETSRRASKALYYELCAGLTTTSPKITTFPVKAQRPGMVVSSRIPVRSLCAHHFLPFTGYATVGYIPTKLMLGLSKFSRVVEWYARRPQVQEDLTDDIADALLQCLFKDEGWSEGSVGVVIRATHCCMEVRGVNHGSDVVTSALRGAFMADPAVRAEFLHLAGASS